MNSRGDWPRIAVVGAGGVGSYFGGLMAHAGAPVVMIGREAFVQAVKDDGLVLDTARFCGCVKVEASLEMQAACDAELILFSVKTFDNASASRELATYLNPDATVVSLQNGVDNVKQIREASGIEALAGLVYVAVAADTPGRVKDAGRGGWDLVIGPKCGRARGVAEMFARAGVPCRVSRNMQSELWTKLIWNCALNAISGLGKAKYGEIAGSREAREMVRAVVSEVLEVARAARIVLPGFENTHPAMEGAMKIAAQMAEARSSTARDLERGKRTEIDSLNGYIARCGERLGIATPVNQALTALVKLREVRPSAPAG